MQMQGLSFLSRAASCDKGSLHYNVVHRIPDAGGNWPDEHAFYQGMHQSRRVPQHVSDVTMLMRQESCESDLQAGGFQHLLATG